MFKGKCKIKIVHGAWKCKSMHFRLCKGYRGESPCMLDMILDEMHVQFHSLCKPTGLVIVAKGNFLLLLRTEPGNPTHISCNVECLMA
jgi:hypothetical protein